VHRHRPAPGAPPPADPHAHRARAGDPHLLPAAERTHHEAELAGIQRLHRREGLAPALKVVTEVLGIDPANPGAEPDLTPQPMTPERIADFG
jgi:hypothetical protein